MTSGKIVRNTLKLAIIVCAILAARAFGHFSIPDIAVLSWLLFIALWQKEGSVTVFAGLVVAMLHIAMRVFRPGIVVEHLGFYAIGMVVVGVCVALGEMYDIFSREFWVRMVAGGEAKALAKELWVKIKNYLSAILHRFLAIPLHIRIKYGIIAMLFIGLLVFTEVQLLGILIWLFFLSGLLFEWDSRISFVLVLLGMLGLPFLLIGGWAVAAELVGVYSFYFFAIGIIQEIVVIYRHKEKSL